MGIHWDEDTVNEYVSRNTKEIIKLYIDVGDKNRPIKGQMDRVYTEITNRMNTLKRVKGIWDYDISKLSIEYNWGNCTDINITVEIKYKTKHNMDKPHEYHYTTKVGNF